MEPESAESRPRPRVEESPLQRAFTPGRLGYYQPRRGDDGKWRYSMRVARTGGLGRTNWYAVGYCRLGDCAGHDTADSSRNHFRLYLVQQQTKLNIPRGDGVNWEFCAKCAEEEATGLWLLELLASRGPWWLGEWIARKIGGVTQHFAIVAGGAFSWPLCYQHQTRAVVDYLLPEDIGETIG